MTLDQFLDEYVPNVLRPMGGWEFHYGTVRRAGQIARCCPLTAATGHSVDAFKECGRRLGLGAGDISRIVTAADDHPDNEKPDPNRIRLLAGLGLTEPA